MAYDRLLQGESIREIFRRAGFDVEDLGYKRLMNFRASVEEMSEKENGFADGRAGNHRKEATSDKANQIKKIRQLEHEVAYLEQENEFLKKIQEAEKECREQAVKSKCRRK